MNEKKLVSVIRYLHVVGSLRLHIKSLRFVRSFSEQGPSGLVELAKAPAFVAYAREAGNITQLTYPTFVQLNARMKQKLEARLTEQGLAAWK